jgi:hypothetical protein
MGRSDPEGLTRIHCSSENSDHCYLNMSGEDLGLGLDSVRLTHLPT